MKELFILVLTFCSYQALSQQGNSRDDVHAAQRGVVLLNNGNATVPLKSLNDLNIAAVDLGYKQTAVFDSIASCYWKLKSFKADTIVTAEGFFALHDRLKLYNLVIFRLSDQTRFSPLLLDFLRDMESQTSLVFILSGKGTNLQHLEGFSSAIIWNESDNDVSASFAAQVLFGGTAASGRLNADYGGGFKKGSGYSTAKIRLGYSSPSILSRGKSFEKGIDSIVTLGIAAHYAPSVVVLVAKDGNVIFNKAYGSHTYEGREPTQVDDIFDMASVTKITATTPSIMRLYEQKKIGLDSLISKYVASTRNIPDKKDIRIKEALLHEAGYYPYIKFYEYLKPGDTSNDSSAAHPIKVADHYFLRADFFEDVMWPMTLASHGNSRGKFVYSDISMYMLKEVIEQTSHRKLNEYVLNEFYRPLGMQSTGFLPRERFNRSRIVPTTENDNWFRNMLVQGYVNDPGAAMAGGVEGHAGLFSNANDLAIYYQMLLNKGEYGGVRFFQPTTVDLFTSRQSKVTTRGYGFARLTEAEQKSGKVYPSQKAFGHSGYTGTYVWVDPEYNMVFICLTNRVYPDDNKTYGIPRINLRARVLDFVYEEMIKEK